MFKPTKIVYFSVITLCLGFQSYAMAFGDMDYQRYGRAGIGQHHRVNARFQRADYQQFDGRYNQARPHYYTRENQARVANHDNNNVAQSSEQKQKLQADYQQNHGATAKKDYQQHKQTKTANNVATPTTTTPTKQQLNQDYQKNHGAVAKTDYQKNHGSQAKSVYQQNHQGNTVKDKYAANHNGQTLPPVGSGTYKQKWQQHETNKHQHQINELNTIQSSRLNYWNNYWHNYFHTYYTDQFFFDNYWYNQEKNYAKHEHNQSIDDTLMGLAIGIPVALGVDYVAHKLENKGTTTQTVAPYGTSPYGYSTAPTPVYSSAANSGCVIHSGGNITCPTNNSSASSQTQAKSTKPAATTSTAAATTTTAPAATNTATKETTTVTTVTTTTTTEIVPVSTATTNTAPAAKSTSTTSSKSSTSTPPASTTDSATSTPLAITPANSAAAQTTTTVAQSSAQAPTTTAATSTSNSTKTATNQSVKCEIHANGEITCSNGKDYEAAYAQK